MITVFYANRVYSQHETWRDFRINVNPVSTPEVYNGAFLYDDTENQYFGWYIGWYRADGIPYPEDQIDPRMKAWLLLLD